MARLFCTVSITFLVDHIGNCVFYSLFYIRIEVEKIVWVNTKCHVDVTLMSAKQARSGSGENVVWLVLQAYIQEKECIWIWRIWTIQIRYIEEMLSFFWALWDKTLKFELMISIHFLVQHMQFLYELCWCTLIWFQIIKIKETSPLL